MYTEISNLGNGNIILKSGILAVVPLKKWRCPIKVNANCTHVSDNGNLF